MVGFLTCLSFLKKILAVAVLGILLINVMRCALRSSQWRSEEQLFKSALSVCPLNAKVSHSCGLLIYLFFKKKSGLKFGMEEVLCIVNVLYSVIHSLAWCKNMTLTCQPPKLQW